MVEPPTAFFSPFMLSRVLWYELLQPFLLGVPLVGRLLAGARGGGSASPQAS